MYPTSHLNLIDITQNTPRCSPGPHISLCLRKPSLLWKVSIHCPLWGKVNVTLLPLAQNHVFPPTCSSHPPLVPQISAPRITFCQRPSLTPNYPSSLTAALSLGSGFKGKTSYLVSSTLSSVKKKEVYPGYMVPRLPPCRPHANSPSGPQPPVNYIVNWYFEPTSC